jgi:hypothetical protein
MKKYETDVLNILSRAERGILECQLLMNVAIDEMDKIPGPLSDEFVAKYIECVLRIHSSAKTIV